MACLLLETSYGDLVIDLDVVGSPVLCRNVIRLAEARYYTGCLFHRIVPHRFACTGDPTGVGHGGTCAAGLLDAYQHLSGASGGGDGGGDGKAINTETLQTCILQSRKRFLKSTTAAAGRRLTQVERQQRGIVVAAEIPGQPDTIGSQFWITIGQGPDRALDGYNDDATSVVPASFTTTTAAEDTNKEPTSRFLSLGKVVEDQDGVLNKLEHAYCDSLGRPYADVRIRRALIVYDSWNPPPHLHLSPSDGTMSFPSPPLPVLTWETAADHVAWEQLLRHRGVIRDTVRPSRILASPSPVRPAEEVVSARILVEDVEAELADHTAAAEDPSWEEDPEAVARRRALDEELKRREDQSRAVVLEMLGDLPDAEIRAPENVLFLCKLNRVTTDEDLELILSRFDPNVHVDVIRDDDTGQSLQYAFAEFTTKQQAAEAYFKMNNALVDDRRIRVDFSQSVSKVWDRFRQQMRRGRGGGQALGQKHPVGSRRPGPPADKKGMPRLNVDLQTKQNARMDSSDRGFKYAKVGPGRPNQRGDTRGGSGGRESRWGTREGPTGQVQDTFVHSMRSSRDQPFAEKRGEHIDGHERNSVIHSVHKRNGSSDGFHRDSDSKHRYDQQNTKLSDLQKWDSPRSTNKESNERSEVSYCVEGDDRSGKGHSHRKRKSRDDSSSASESREKKRSGKTTRHCDDIGDLTHRRRRSDGEEDSGKGNKRSKDRKRHRHSKGYDEVHHERPRDRKYRSWRFDSDDSSDSGNRRQNRRHDADFRHGQERRRDKRGTDQTSRKGSHDRHQQRRGDRKECGQSRSRS